MPLAISQLIQLRDFQIYEFQGEKCELRCQNGTFGVQCRQKCDCGEFPCDNVHGTCICPVGLQVFRLSHIFKDKANSQGPRCDEKCRNGRFGPNCDLIAQCFNGARSDHRTGTCFCSPGFYGPNCLFEIKGTER